MPNELEKGLGLSSSGTGSLATQLSRSMGVEPISFKQSRKTLDLSDTKDLIDYAAEKGITSDQNKPSFFRRALDVMSRGNYMSANVVKDFVDGGEFTPIQSAWRGLKGQDKTTYSDVLATSGVENKILRGGLGFVLDVALDPTTYFGGTIIKGIGTGVKSVAKPIGKVVAKANPVFANHIIDAATSLQDAFGTAFKFGYNVTPELSDDVVRTMNKTGIARDEIIDKYTKVFQPLNKTQQREFAETLIKTRKDIRAYEVKRVKELVDEGIPGPESYKSAEEFAKDPLIQEAKKYKSAEEFVGSQKGRFHGTSIEIKKLASDEELYSPQNIYGQGFYTTDRHAIAEGYSRKGGGETPTIYNVKEKAKVPVYNIEQKMDDSLLKEINAKVNEGDAYTKDYTLRDVYDDIRELSQAGEISSDTAQNYFNTIKEILQKKGFRGIEHTGGKLTGNAEHNVKIYWNPAKDLDYSKGLTKSQLTDIWKKANKGDSLPRKMSTEEALLKARSEANESIKPIFKDAVQQEVFEKGLKPEIDNLADMAGLDDAFKVDAYYPIMDVEKMDKVDKTGRVLAQGNKGYLDEYKAALGDEKILKKPIEAFSRREMEVARDVLNKETLDSAVKQYGLSKEAFDKLDDATKALYKEIKDKKLGGKSVGFLKARDAEFINDYLFPEFKTIDILAQASGYDGLTKTFKTAVTSWFPAFHARNFVSGVAQNYEVFGKEGLNPTNYMTALGIAKGSPLPLVIKNWRGKVMYQGTGDDLLKAIKAKFGGASRYVSDLGDYIDDIGGGKFQFKKIVDPGRKLGNAIETYHKIAGTVMGLKQGKGLDEAMALAEKAGFDYTKITKFEAKIMRRMIPFYTFMRKNAALQLDTLVHHPERIINQAKLANGLSEMLGGKVTEEDVKGLPDWVLSGLGFKMSNGQYLSQFGLPIEEFIATVNSPLMKTLTSLNPIIKYPIESKLGYDFFREQEIVDIKNVAPATGAKLYELDQKGYLPTWLSDSLNITKREYKGEDIYEMSPTKLHLLRNLPTARLQNTFERMFDEDIKSAEKWTAFFSGAKIYDIDLEKQAYFKEKDLRTDIQRQLLELGEGQQFKTFYIYK